MSKEREALKLALEALIAASGHVNNEIFVKVMMARDAVNDAIREALAPQPAQQQEPYVHAISGKTADELWLETGRLRSELADLKAQQQEPEPDRVKFERHWRKTRGEKKANRELPRHPLQPQTYIQDSANRHWVTWQAAVRSVFPPASKPWVGLTDEEIQKADCLNIMWNDGESAEIYNIKEFARALEAKLREKNAAPCKPLTDEQIEAIHQSTWMQSTATLNDFARAIEAAHGIKE